MNKSAKEMFEELGYKRQETLNQIIYENDWKLIEFNKNSFRIYMNSKSPYQGFVLDNNLIIKAITQQIKELRWSND